MESEHRTAKDANRGKKGRYRASREIGNITAKVERPETREPSEKKMNAK